MSRPVSPVPDPERLASRGPAPLGDVDDDRQSQLQDMSRLDAELLQLAATHASEVRQLQQKFEAAVQQLEVTCFRPRPTALDTEELDKGSPRFGTGADRSSERTEAADEVGPVPDHPVPVSPSQATGITLSKSRSASKKMRMSTAISRVLKGPQHPTQQKQNKKGGKPNTEALRLRRRLNQKTFAADHYANDGDEDERQPSWFDRQRLVSVVTHPIFDALTALVILLNAATIGAETQYSAMDVALPSSLELVSQLCTFYFVIELLLRIGAHQVSWFFDMDMRLWNFFDLILVALSVIDFMVVRLLNDDAAAGFDTVKMLKTLRIIRVFRVFRFFRQLTQLALMITDSIKSLIWALVLLAIIIYVFAIFLTANVSSWILPFLGNPGEDWQLVAAEHDDFNIRVLESAYGSLPQTIYTLVLAVLGGRSWHEVCTPLMKVGWFPVMLLLVYVAFVVLAVLNVVTGVFVDNAFRCAEKQRSLAIQKEMDRQEQFIQQIRDFFAAMDQDDSGDVTPDELAEMLKDPTLSAYFRVLGFEIDDANRFIDLLDKDEDGAISVDEFLRGCLKFRGGAAAVDMHQCLRLVRQLQRTVTEMKTGPFKTLGTPMSAATVMSLRDSSCG